MASDAIGPFQAVTFDYWNTIAWESSGHLAGRRNRAWAGILEEAGLGVEHATLVGASAASWRRYQARWAANRQYLAEHALDDLLGSIRVDPPGEIRTALLEVFAAVGRDADLRLAEGVGDCLRALNGAGVRLAVVCDVGMTPSSVLRGRLEGWGLLELFDHCSFSDEIGVYKPAKRIFLDALRGLGSPDPARTAHVGDCLRTDVAGARAMGMVSVRYTGVYDDPQSAEGLPDADLVVASHADLPALLGV